MKSKATCLVLSGVRGDTRRYRALHLLEQLQLLGVQCSFLHLTDPDLRSHIHPSLQLVFFHRVPYSSYVGSIIDMLRARDIPIISDYDDLVFDPSVFEYINSPDFADPIRSALYKENMINLRKVIELSHAVTVSTQFLGNRISTLGKQTWIHRNAFNLEMLRNSQHALLSKSRIAASQDGRVVIGYASGTPTHNRDFAMVQPVLKQLMQQYPQVELRLLGPLDPGSDWGDAQQRILQFPLVPWRNLPMRLAQFDINLSPLVLTNPFTQSKSEIKYVEAGLVQVPTVASPSDAFCTAIRSGENGYLAESREEWFATLSNLIEDRSLREQIGQQAYNAVLSDYHPVTRASQLAILLEEMMTTFHNKPFWQEPPVSRATLEIRSQEAVRKNQWLPAKYEKDPNNLQLGVYSLRHAGLKKTLKQVWIYFRRLVSPIFPFKTPKP